eukprot:592492-Prorocentrum_minimum.AAC.1
MSALTPAAGVASLFFSNVRWYLARPASGRRSSGGRRASPEAEAALEEGGRSDGGERAHGHDCHAVAEQVRLVHEVRREHHRAPAPVLANHLPRHAPRVR